MMRRPVALCLLLLALALVGSGCGSESGGDSPGGPADTQQPATTEKDEGDYGY